MFRVEELKQLSDFLLGEFKLVFATKEEMNAGFEEINQKISNLTTAVDGFMKTSVKNEQEILVMGHRLEKIEQKI